MRNDRCREKYSSLKVIKSKNLCMCEEEIVHYILEYAVVRAGIEESNTYYIYIYIKFMNSLQHLGWNKCLTPSD